MKKLFFLCLAIVFFSSLRAQDNADIFLKEIATKQGIDIQWQERKTSFTAEGFRSFVGYYENHFVASISIGKQSVSGSFNYNGVSYEITSQKGNIIFRENTHQQCSTDEAEGNSHPFAYARNSILATEEEKPQINNTQVLRIYRLAIPIAYNYYKEDWVFGSIEKVKTFWADTEAFLNEVYVRDLGIRFELVNDERLILTTASQERFDETQKASVIINTSTQVINDLIGKQNYDLGLCISKFTSKGLSGLAYVRYAYTSDKAAAIARPTKQVICHEIGHLFGGRHTFSSDYVDPGSEKTEYGRGQSVMSYGNPRDFFSLSSIKRIREFLVHTPYYSDKARTKVVGDASFPNIPYGIHFNSQAPNIDKTKVKKYYTIPENTFFQFYIPATDTDSEQLLYTANQHDERFGQQETLTQYLIYKPTTTNPVSFKREYSERTGNEVANSWLSSQKAGTFTFWLGASDAQPQQSANYAVQYDLVETKVTVKGGTPFKLTSPIKTKYQGGEQLTLTWNVDSAIFSNTKVRILLSDDLGKTFKHIIVPETENDGSEKIVLPNITTSKAVLKIEVIDGLAFDLTNYNPKNGGFTIEKDNTLPSEPLSWVTLPNNLTVDCAKAVPAVVIPTTQGGCATVNISFSEKETNKICPNNYTLERTFTATDGCQTLTHTQLIKVEDKIAPSFVGSLPQDITIEEGEAIPLQVSISAEDTCAGQPTVTRTQKEELTADGKRSKLIYIWVARDVCGNQRVHTQTISLASKSVTKKVVIYNGVSDSNYFKIENTDEDKPITLIIFDEMGLKVYESDNYQQNDDYFRGYANVQGVVNRTKRLAGTYFYIVTYFINGQQQVKKGFLYVK